MAIQALTRASLDAMIRETDAMLQKAQSDIDRITGISAILGIPGPGYGFAGMKIHTTAACLTPADTPAFPVSRHRSRRLHKKLERRFGPQWPMRPAAYRLNDTTLLVHPRLLDRVQREMAAKIERDAQRVFTPLFGV